MEIKMKLDADKLRQIAMRVAAELIAATKDLKRARGVIGLYKLLPTLVDHVEAVGAELKLLGEDKKAIAVEAILAAVPDRWAPDWILRPVVAWAIERAVSAYNNSQKKSGL